MPPSASADDGSSAASTYNLEWVDLGITGFDTVAAEASDVGNVIDDRYSGIDAPSEAPPYPITCYQPEFSRNRGTSSGQIAFTFTATNGCNGRSHVKIWNFYIHSTSWGQGTPTASCESYDGLCDARVHWASKPLPCNTRGVMNLPFSLNWYNKTYGNRFTQGTDRVAYTVTCT